jgi:hypothetical protein
MKSNAAVLAALLAATSAATTQARAQPHICPTAASTLAVDLGNYHGSAWITDADGRGAFAGPTRYDCPATSGQHAWQSCNFSVCELPDGDYGLHFSRMKPPAEIAFALTGGMLRLAPTELAVQAGNYGIDATGSRVPVFFDLHGYTLTWSLEAWPGGPFHGTDTGGRGQTHGDIVSLSLYPATPYVIRFGNQPSAVLMLGFDGKPQLMPATAATHGRPLEIADNRLVLRTAQLTIEPAAPGTTWHTADLSPAPGPRTLVLPADSSFTLTDDQHNTTETLTIDDDCRPSGTHAFAVTNPPGCSR